MARLEAIVLYFCLFCAHAAVIDFQKDAGGIPGDKSAAVEWKNGALLNTTLNALSPGDILVVPTGTFHVMGGVIVRDIHDVVIKVDGTLSFSTDLDAWPTSDGKTVLMCLYFANITNVTFTSTNQGLLDGQGAAWWGIPGIGYLERGENRPRLLEIHGGSELLVENIFFKNSPYWTFWAHGVDGLEVRNCAIDARRDDADRHDIIDMTAFNTDGFDVSGKNIWIHDCSVWNQDDTFCVKDNTENVLIERVNASGVGLTIGSISSNVRNVTFRDVYMHHSYKGIYLKFRGPGNITDILYENIIIDTPSQWPIWIGPAQQSDSDNPCAAHPCSICWPRIPFAKCNSPEAAFYTNITLRNITITNPKLSPGVILANSASPMVNVVFDSVKVTGFPNKPFDGYHCDGVESGVAIGDTFPVPSCFKDLTNAALARKRNDQRDSALTPSLA